MSFYSSNASHSKSNKEKNLKLRNNSNHGRLKSQLTSRKGIQFHNKINLNFNRILKFPPFLIKLTSHPLFISCSRVIKKWVIPLWQWIQPIVRFFEPKLIETKNNLLSKKFKKSSTTSASIQRSSFSSTSSSSSSSSSLLQNSLIQHQSQTFRQKKPLNASLVQSSVKKKKILVLDLDETLIHSTTCGIYPWDFRFEVKLNQQHCLFYVYKRPHLDFFLKKVLEWYQVVIFTASLQAYADPVINFLDDPLKKFSGRYFRQDCKPYQDGYIKDLSSIEPDLGQICIVDNSPISYALQQANAIPIDGWVSGDKDETLLDLLPFLDALRFIQDVRSVLGLRLYSFSQTNT